MHQDPLLGSLCDRSPSVLGDPKTQRTFSLDLAEPRDIRWEYPMSLWKLTPLSNFKVIIKSNLANRDFERSCNKASVHKRCPEGNEKWYPILQKERWSSEIDSECILISMSCFVCYHNCIPSQKISSTHFKQPFQCARTHFKIFLHLMYYNVGK